MAEKTEKTKQTEQEKDNKIIEFELPSGINVKMDLTKFTVATVMKARQMANSGFKTPLYIFADICTFDGKELNVPEIEGLCGYDLMTLEDVWADGKKLVSQKQK